MEYYIKNKNDYKNLNYDHIKQPFDISHNGILYECIEKNIKYGDFIERGNYDYFKYNLKQKRLIDKLSEKDIMDDMNIHFMCREKPFIIAMEVTPSISTNIKETYPIQQTKQIEQLQVYKFMELGSGTDEYIIKNKKRIIELTKKCFNITSDDQLNAFLNSWHIFIEKPNWFFVTHDDILIGYCICHVQSIYLLNTDVSTYKAIDHLYSNNRINIYPYLSNLCKDVSYPNVGKFILDKVSEWYKSKGYNELYLIPGSSRYKCSKNPNEYYKANMKLVEYYKTNGFKIKEKYYNIANCDNKFVYSNVMSRV